MTDVWCPMCQVTSSHDGLVIRDITDAVCPVCTTRLRIVAVPVGCAYEQSEGQPGVREATPGAPSL